MSTLSFKAAPSEAKSIRAAARAKHLTVSEYLRRAALPESSTRQSTPKHVLKPGRVVIHGAHDAPKLSSDDVSAALYD